MEQIEVVVQLEVLLTSFGDIQRSYVLDSRIDDKPLEGIELSDVLSSHKKCTEMA